MWDPQNERLPREELTKLQLERVRQTVEHANARVPFYRKSFDAAGVRPEQLRTLADVQRFPFIRKQDFRDAYPWTLLAVPREQVREVHASSGTTGAISLTGYTDGDLRVWTELVARVFGCAGARPGDLVQNADVYGLAEAIGPGVSCECVEEQHGLHVFEDHFIVECIDPNTGELVPDGTAGELVFTSLTKEALPIVRYRTGDISALDPTPCSCGRTSRRMARISGRTDDMLVVRGINLFPSDVESILLGIPELSPQYRLVVDREKALDTIEVHVEARDPAVGDANALGERVAMNLRNALGIHVDVSIVAAHVIPRSEGKALRVVDRRKL